MWESFVNGSVFTILLSLDSNVMLFFLALCVFNTSSLLAFSGFSLSINSDCAVGSEYLEREPSKLYPDCSSMHTYHPFPLGYQDASPTPGIPLQWGFRHVSCSQYYGGGWVSAILTSFWVSPYSIALAAFIYPQSQETS